MHKKNDLRILTYEAHWLTVYSPGGNHLLVVACRFEFQSLIISCGYLLEKQWKTAMYTAIYTKILYTRIGTMKHVPQKFYAETQD